MRMIEVIITEIIKLRTISEVAFTTNLVDPMLQKIHNTGIQMLMMIAVTQDRIIILVTTTLGDQITTATLKIPVPINIMVTRASEEKPVSAARGSTVSVALGITRSNMRTLTNTTTPAAEAGTPAGDTHTEIGGKWETCVKEASAEAWVMNETTALIHVPEVWVELTKKCQLKLCRWNLTLVVPLLSILVLILLSKHSNQMILGIYSMPEKSELQVLVGQ